MQRVTVDKESLLQAILKCGGKEGFAVRTFRSVRTVDRYLASCEVPPSVAKLVEKLTKNERR